MSISKRIEEALNQYQSGDYEACLIPLSIAIDATASKVHPNEKKNNNRYKRLISDGMPLISKFGFVQSQFGAFRVRYPPLSGDGKHDSCDVTDILYHAVRCSLLHEAKMPGDIHFIPENVIKVKDDQVWLPAAFIRGMILLVLTCHVNDTEKLSGDWSILMNGINYDLNQFWGNSDSLLALYN